MVVLYDSSAIMINVHQTVIQNPHHHTLEEFLVLHVLLWGVVIDCVRAPTSCRGHTVPPVCAVQLTRRHASQSFWRSCTITTHTTACFWPRLITV